MKLEGSTKPRIVFPFVEAGLGHIMPMRAVHDAFKQKYGAYAEIIKIDFFKETKNPDLEFIENELIKEVKLHNKHKMRGGMQFFLMRLLGSRICMRYLMEKRYKRAFQPAIKLIEELNADLIFNTHFSTLYYACEARERGLSRASVITYCPDPIIGRQWDLRSDLIALSSETGRLKAEKEYRKHKSIFKVVPFLIRSEVKSFIEDKAFYRRYLKLPEDNFTILLADGAYGAGKLEKTVHELLKSKKTLTIVAVCGKNERLYNSFKTIDVPKNIHFAPFGFTDKMLELAASCDLFIGKAGASNLAEPAYFGAPSIITFCATPIEKWICSHYVQAGCAIKCENIKKAVMIAERFKENPFLMNRYKTACKSQHRADGPELLADVLWGKVSNKNSPITD